MMRIRQALQKKKASEQSAIAPNPQSLAARAFAVQPPSQENETSQTTPGLTLPLARLAIMRPDAGQTMPVQPKLTIGAANDKYEQEADRVADQVVQRLAHPETEADDAALQTQAEGRSLQRDTDPEDDDELQMKPATGQIQRRGAEPSSATPELEESIQQVRGSGQPLADTVREPMERAFGADFRGVKVHTDPQSDQLNQSIQARAFTTGQDIFFRDGAYQPQSSSGQHLIAHELTHVVQQNSSVQRREDEVRLAPAAAGSIQRLVGAKTFKKKTKLFGRKGTSHQTFEQIEQGLAAYHNNAGADAKTKADQLDQLLAIAQTWLASPAAAQSSRKKYVERLIPDLENELETLLNTLESVEEDDLDEQNLDLDNTKGTLDNHDGQMSEVAYLKYRFGVRKTKGGAAKKMAGETSGWYFKPDVAVDTKNRQHRGEANSGSGIPVNNPEFAKRNIAMSRLDQLLNADVIPPTFATQYNQKAGMVMKEVVGKSEKDIALKVRRNDPEAPALEAALKSGVARRALSKLYLLDIIAGQVDRHWGNYIVELDQNNKATGVKGIDNDLAFGKNYQDIGYGSEHQFAHQKVAGKLAHELAEIDADFAQSIVNLVNREAEVRAALDGLITQTEIDATISRLQSLAGYLQQLITAGSDRLKQSDQWQDN